MKLRALVHGHVMFCLVVAAACGGSDPDVGVDDTEAGSTGSPLPTSQTTDVTVPDGTTSGPGGDSSTSAEQMTGSPTGSSTGSEEYDGPYNAPPDCEVGEFILEFPEGLSVCSASCADEPCPDPEIAGVQPMCAVTVNGGAEPSQCILGCDPANDTCPGDTTCELVGGGNFCAGGDSEIGGTGDPPVDPPASCATACEILKNCDFGGPVTLLTEAECNAECEANIAADVGDCQSRLDTFLMCLEDVSCFAASDRCLATGSAFQLCLI